MTSLKNGDFVRFVMTVWRLTQLENRQFHPRTYSMYGRVLIQQPPAHWLSLTPPATANSTRNHGGLLPPRSCRSRIHERQDKRKRPTWIHWEPVITERIKLHAPSITPKVAVWPQFRNSEHRGLYTRYTTVYRVWIETY